MVLGVNWNEASSQQIMFWQQNIRQFWIDEEIPLTDDKQDWIQLTDGQKDVYKKVSVALTILDTLQGGEGMHAISGEASTLHDKAILQYMAFMEQMHAKSYSSIFSTLCTEKEIDELFNWGHTSEIVQKKVKFIQKYYDKEQTPGLSPNERLYLQMCVSVFLESFIFYSGFFYPLYLAGQGKMKACGEIFNLIIRDELIHGLYVGLQAQELFKTLSPDTQKHFTVRVKRIFESLYEYEKEYTQELYKGLGLEKEVLKFVQYQGDKALMNIGYDPHFNIEESEVNSIVLAGLDTKTKNHDFFSQKGNGYIKATNVSKLSDEDFAF